MDRSEGERRAAKRPKDQPESEGSRASRSRRSVTKRSAEAASVPQRDNVVADSISLASPQAGSLAHSVAPPFKIEPAALGFDFVKIPNRRGRR